MSDKSTQPSPPDLLPVLDRQALLDRVVGDEPLMREILQIFRDERERRMAAVRQAMEARDAAAIGVAAHAINGAAGNIGAERVRRVAARLQNLGRSGSLDGADEAWAELQEEMHALDRQLAVALAPEVDARGAGA